MILGLPGFGRGSCTYIKRVLLLLLWGGVFVWHFWHGLLDGTDGGADRTSRGVDVPAGAAARREACVGPAAAWCEALSACMAPKYCPLVFGRPSAGQVRAGAPNGSALVVEGRPLRYIRIHGGFTPYPSAAQRTCFRCDMAHLCRMAKRPEGRWLKPTGSYWRKMVNQTYCDGCPAKQPKGNKKKRACMPEVAKLHRRDATTCCLPALINMGPGRTGTTALATYTAAHIRWTMGITKEHNWVDSALRGAPTVLGPAALAELQADYAQHFPAPDAETAGIDMSVFYYHGIRDGRARQMKLLLPDARLLVLLRNPIDRMYAVFRDLIFHRGGWKAAGFGQAEAFDIYARVNCGSLAQMPETAHARLLQGGGAIASMALMGWAPVDYLRLRPWLRVFKKQVLLVPSRDLHNRTTRPEVLSEIMMALGLNANETAWDLTQKEHRSGGGKGWARESMLPSTRKAVWVSMDFSDKLAQLQQLLCVGVGVGDGGEPDAETTVASTASGGWLADGGVKATAGACATWLRRAFGCEEFDYC